MIDFKGIEGFYFVGIGGIGMSALALYFRKGGYTIAGYDRTAGRITDNLTLEGCEISFKDEIQYIPSPFREVKNRDKVIIVYTPAIPSESCILNYFRENGYRLYKRSEVLGEISSKTDTIAVAGTHGKTTVSTMIAFLLNQSHVGCSAFLGGISKNYDSNLLIGEGRYTVMEADEYDRSFHRLSPLMAVVTSVDADHLDIYGDHKTMIAAYNEFCSKIRIGGTLLINSRIRKHIVCPQEVQFITYGTDPDADFRCFDIEHKGDFYTFSIKTPCGTISELHFPFPGIINVENMTAAVAIALNCGVKEEEIRREIIFFKGVRRRFDIRVNLPGIAYVDDYAHHPEEIRACVMSLREYFRGRKITGIFQPHLFSRTLDHADSFAAILDELDEVILLPVYPAREKPIPGVSSELILEKMKLKRKRLIPMNDLPDNLDIKKLDVLATIGAGDIDRLVGPIEEKIKREAGQ
jgi:UDP-N-acetylmuramate--alanine ligase